MNNPYIETLQVRCKQLDAGTGGGRGLRAALKACKALDDCGSLDSNNTRAAALALLSCLHGTEHVGQIIVQLRDWLNFEADEARAAE